MHLVSCAVIMRNCPAQGVIKGTEVDISHVKNVWKGADVSNG